MSVKYSEDGEFVASASELQAHHVFFFLLLTNVYCMQVPTKSVLFTGAIRAKLQVRLKANTAWVLTTVLGSTVT